MDIFCDSELPVFLGKIVRKSLEWPYLAILNLYQSFWGENCQKKFGTAIFGHSEFWEKNCQKKFGTAIFGHSEFIPVFLGKIVRKNLEQPFLAIPNLYQSFWENCQKKFRITIFGHSEFIPIFLGKNCWKIFRMAIFGHSKFIPVFLGKIVGKIHNGHFLPF